jgi:hypothetical protein
MSKYIKTIIKDEEHITLNREDGTNFSFVNVDSVDIPERQAYLAWVAEGNEAEEYNFGGSE